MKTSGRLLYLLSLLQARRDWPGAALAERLDISPRTVRRDVDRLRELGYLITAVKGPDGGYRLGSGADLPPLLFDDEQVVALTIGLQLAATSGVDIEEAAVRALHTVSQVMPSRLRHRVDTLKVTSVRRSSAAEVDHGLLATLSAAIHGRETLRFDYASPGRPPSSGTAARRAEPHHLVTRGGSWYLVAWDLDRDDWRTFRVDRLTPRAPNGPRFTERDVPGSDVASFVTGRFKGSDIASDWPCQGEVILDLPATDVAPYVLDGVVASVAPDRCRLTIGAWSWIALAASIGRFDADIEIVGPDELREAFDRLARRYERA